jgi:heme-degrading monooxygenase HmoA
MYGTIARIKVKPEDWDELKKSVRRGPLPEGEGAMMLFQMDADPLEVFMIAVAESEKVYRDLSESPEMHEAYLERRQKFETEPEWHDGKVILFRHHPVPEDAQLYGSIAEMCLKPGALEALMDQGEGEESPNGAVALCVFQMDADPNQVFMVAVSESEEAYRAYSESQESHQQYTEMLKSLQDEPKWHDGHVLEYEVFTN